MSKGTLSLESNTFSSNNTFYSFSTLVPLFPDPYPYISEALGSVTVCFHLSGTTPQKLNFNLIPSSYRILHAHSYWPHSYEQSSLLAHSRSFTSDTLGEPTANSSTSPATSPDPVSRCFRTRENNTPVTRARKYEKNRFCFHRVKTTKKEAVL